MKFVVSVNFWDPFEKLQFGYVKTFQEKFRKKIWKNKEKYERNCEKK